MAGEPAETMIGVGILGFGAVLVIAAFKNVSPLALIKAAVTEGKLTLEGLPKIDDGSGSGSADSPGAGPTDPNGPTPVPTEVQAIIEKARPRSPQFVAQFEEGIKAIAGNRALASLRAPVLYAQIASMLSLGYITAAEGEVLRGFVDQRVSV